MDDSKCVERESTPFEESMGRINIRIGEIEDAVDKVKGRCSPVLVPEEDAVPSADKEVISRCAYESTVRDLEHRLCRLSENVMSVYERCVL